MHYAADSDLGRVRTNNEDVWCIEPSIPLFLICDGIGGHSDGEVAAALTAETFKEYMSSKVARQALDHFLAKPTLECRMQICEVLKQAGTAASTRVYTEGQKKTPPTIMGCTLDAILLLGDQVFVAHLGDSRVYLARGSITSQITSDHSLYHASLARGTLAPSSPQPLVDPLINAVGLNTNPIVDILTFSAIRGDRILLCTDGIHGSIPNHGDLARLLRHGSVEEVVRDLIEAANYAGGRDNSTAIVVEIAERFVTRTTSDESWKEADQVTLRGSALLSRLPEGLPQRVISQGVEVQAGVGTTLPRVNCRTLVAYVLLEGHAKLNNRPINPSSVLYPESLVGGMRDGALAIVERPVRALRWRAEDFRDFCASDLNIAALLYERIARLLAR